MFEDKINLASKSPRRRELIQIFFNNVDTLGLSFEEPRWKSGMIAETYITHCVKAKWRAACDEYPEKTSKEFLLVADTIVVLGKKVLGKPLDPADAKDMLGALSGRRHLVLSAFQLGRANSQIFKIVSTEVEFLNLSSAQISAYVKSKEPMDKAGAYGFQGLGMKMIRAVRGPYASVMGLPIMEVANAAKKLGLK